MSTLHIEYLYSVCISSVSCQRWYELKQNKVIYRSRLTKTCSFFRLFLCQITYFSHLYWPRANVILGRMWYLLFYYSLILCVLFGIPCNDLVMKKRHWLRSKSLNVITLTTNLWYILCVEQGPLGVNNLRRLFVGFPA